MWLKQREINIRPEFDDFTSFLVPKIKRLFIVGVEQFLSLPKTKNVPEAKSGSMDLLISYSDTRIIQSPTVHDVSCENTPFCSFLFIK